MRNREKSQVNRLVMKMASKSFDLAPRPMRRRAVKMKTMEVVEGKDERNDEFRRSTCVLHLYPDHASLSID